MDFNNIKELSESELESLTDQLRADILSAVSKNGGHLASNLGAVELTVALHRVFDFPNDKLIFDVSHQSYVHKILSGRKDGFEALRNQGGVSGFQLREESEYDFFGGGHSGTSVSAALGFAEADKLRNGNNYAIAVVGDGSFTNGMIYEAINNASKSGLRVIIILNDNKMSISKNVGAVSRYFGRLRTSVRYFSFKRKFKGVLGKMKLVGRPIAFLSRATKNMVKRIVFKTNMFEDLGIDYIGPVDGHDIGRLEAVLKEAKLLGQPVIVHVCTEKGRGYQPAEEHPDIYHSVAPFDVEKGIVSSDADEITSFSEAFGNVITELSMEDENIVAITAAMCEGTGLCRFREEFPDRFYDVGIAEEHAVTFAAGLSSAGKKPIFAVYSSFLQRSYDQMIHDIAIQKLDVVLAIDRAGFVAGDGKTHQGIFDCSMLLSVPGAVIHTPETYSELETALKQAFKKGGLQAVRYPRGAETEYDRNGFKVEDDLKYITTGSGKKITMITYGRITENVVKAARALETDYEITVVSLKKIAPINVQKLYDFCAESELILFVEENIRSGGVSEKLISEFACNGFKLPKVKILAIENDFPTHANLDYLYKQYSLDSESITECIKNNA